MRDFQATFGELVIDGPAWEVRLGGTVIDLTRTEFLILLVLASRSRRVVTDDEVVRAVWGDGWFGDENNLAVHVSKLRHKLGESGLRPRFIRTVRGVGYRFDPGRPSPHAFEGGECACDALKALGWATDVRTDGQLRVIAVDPMEVPVLGYDPRHLLGRYFPVMGGHPWADRAAAVEAVRVLIASGVREWTARHIVVRADGITGAADIATCLDVDDEGNLQELRFVLVECDASVMAGGGGGGGASVNAGHRAPSRLA